MVDIVGQEIKEETNELSGFITSKWETVDPDQIEAQAMTTSKWDLLENSQDASRESSSNENQDSLDYSDTRYILIANDRLDVLSICFKYVMF